MIGYVMIISFKKLLESTESSRRVVVSREAKKKQHARTFQAYATATMSYLHGWSV